MSYVTYPDSQYPKTLGPTGTPGWQFAPVPGWGKNMDYSAAPDMVGIGYTFFSNPKMANANMVDAQWYFGLGIGASIGALATYLLLRRR